MNYMTCTWTKPAAATCHSNLISNKTKQTKQNEANMIHENQGKEYVNETKGAPHPIGWVGNRLSPAGPTWKEYLKGKVGEAGLAGLRAPSW